MKPPPTKSELKILMESLITELNLTGTRAAGLRQKMRPYIYGDVQPISSAAPVPTPSDDEIIAATKNISEQLDLDLHSLMDKMGFSHD